MFVSYVNPYMYMHVKGGAVELNEIKLANYSACFDSKFSTLQIEIQERGMWGQIESLTQRNEIGKIFLLSIWLQR